MPLFTFAEITGALVGSGIRRPDRSRTRGA